MKCVYEVYELQQESTAQPKRVSSGESVVGHYK